MFVIVRGNAFSANGLELVGPFETATAATEEANRSPRSFTIVGLIPPAPPAPPMAALDRVLGPIAVRYGEHNYMYYLDNNPPSCPVYRSASNGSWYICMGFAGFNTRENNHDGYSTSEKALADIRKYQGKSKKK